MRLKKRIIIAAVFSIIVLSCSKSRTNPTNQYPKKDLKICVHSVNQDRAEQKLFNLFEDRNNVKIEVVWFNSSDELIQNISMPQDSIAFDLAMGLNQTTLSFLESRDLGIKFENSIADKISPFLLFDDDCRLIPFCHATLTIFANKNLIDTLPSSFGELQDGIWEDSFLMFNPEKTDIGKGFLFWSIAAFGRSGYYQLFRGIKTNIFSVEPQISLGFNKFLSGEAPFLFAQNSLSKDFPANFKWESIYPKEGNFRMIYCCSILRKQNSKLASDFIEFLLQTDTQKLAIASLGAEAAVKDVQLHKAKSFSAENLNKNLDLDLIEKNQERWIKNWKKFALK